MYFRTCSSASSASRAAVPTHDVGPGHRSRFLEPARCCSDARESAEDNQSSAEREQRAAQTQPVANHKVRDTSITLLRGDRLQTEAAVVLVRGRYDSVRVALCLLAETGGHCSCNR